MSTEHLNVGLSHIFVKNANPFELFKEWFEESEKNMTYLPLHLMNVASVSKEGRVSNRTVLLQDFESNGFIFNTDRKGRKHKEITEHPQVAATIVWQYDIYGRNVQRQVRFEGNAIVLNDSYRQKQFDAAGLNHKIRNMVCNQGDVTEWEDLKKRFDGIVDDVKNKRRPIELRDNLIVYKIIPDRMEFYHAFQDEIADRIVFVNDENGWSFNHVEP